MAFSQVGKSRPIKNKDFFKESLKDIKKETKVLAKANNYKPEKKKAVLVRKFGNHRRAPASLMEQQFERKQIYIGTYNLQHFYMGSQVSAPNNQYQTWTQSYGPINW